MAEITFENGKRFEVVEYVEKYGAFEFPDGFEARLYGKPIVEQAELFAMGGNACYSRSSYGEVDRESVMKRTERVCEDYDVRAIIVKDGIMVGVMVRDCYGDIVPLFPYKSVCTYYSCDNNGAGYKEYESYNSLICLPES